MPRAWTRCAAAAAVAVHALLSACSSAPVIPAPSEVPLSKETLDLLARKGMQPGSPVLVRIFKEESELEVWKQRDDGRYYHFKTYPICNWSGGIGPKLTEGDRQAPEGFYEITPTLMNPNSKYYLSFNLGFPNAYDRSWGRTGSALMVHGKCRSAGCYAMTDALIEEIYGLTRETLKAGYPSFPVRAYPFRMTDERMAALKKEKHKWLSFWQPLKQDYDLFEKYRIPPPILMCERRYVVNARSLTPGKIDAAGPCPPMSRPVQTAFTPLPEPDGMDVANGNKLKGHVDPDKEPTLADIDAAKSAQTAAAPTAEAPAAASTSTSTSTSTATASPGDSGGATTPVSVMASPTTTANP